MFCGVVAYIVISTSNVAGGGLVEGDRVDFESYNVKIIHEVVEIDKENRFDDIIKENAERYSVSFDLMSQIIDCENPARDPELQSRIKYTASQIARHSDWGAVGEYEKSFGLVQIHIPACNKWEGECITEEQAKDPMFSIQYLAHEMAGGRIGKWSCYDLVK